MLPLTPYARAARAGCGAMRPGATPAPNVTRASAPQAALHRGCLFRIANVLLLTRPRASGTIVNALIVPRARETRRAMLLPLRREMHRKLRASATILRGYIRETSAGADRYAP